MKNKITLRSLISLSFLLFFFPFLKMCSKKPFQKVETVEVMAVDSANTIITKNDTILALQTSVERQPELLQQEEYQRESNLESNDSSILNFYELLINTFAEIKFDKSPFMEKTFYPLLGFLLVLISTIIMLVVSFFNKIKTINFLSVINLILLMISAILLYFCGVLESINQIRIGYYLIFLNYVLIIIISRKTLKENRTSLKKISMKLIEENQEKLTILEKIANGIIWWVGSIPSLIFHTVFFIVSFALPIFGIVEFEHMLLVLTTIVSLEAIYLAIFIQMSVNKSTEHIEDLKEDVNEIQEDIDEIQEDIEEIQEDVEEIQEDIDEIQEDVEEINEDDDDEDHSERARTVMLKSKVSNNKNDIKNLKDKIKELENLIESLKKED